MATRPIDPLAPTAQVRLLDPVTVNQIAAGEVVERPASVVKELVENALDAGATVIEVSLEDAGRKLVQVADNGTGMDRGSCLLALQRHATSKISSLDDLMQVATYGFRGEALPSIGSVSRMTVATGTGAGRTLVVVADGEVSHPRHEPGPQGTTVSVEDLFLNVPARLKFLKSDTTEVAAVVDVVSRMAVSRPEVAFRLAHGSSVLVQSSGSGDPFSALAEVWGREVARALVPLDLFNGQVRVTGFVSPPHFTKPTRSMQWFFVNGRPVRNRMLTAALDQAMRSLTPEKRYPVALLHVEIDPAKIDVNVSPTKSEVKFHQEGPVFDGLRRAVKDALLANGMVPSIEDLAAVNQALAPDPAQSGFGGAWTSFGAFPSASPQPSPLWATVAAQAPVGPGAPEGQPATTGRFADLLDGLRVLGQVDDTLIVAENRTSLLVIDQHVAHERILYEMLCRSRGAAPIEQQRLLEPVSLTVGKRCLAVLTERLDDLRDIGFDLEPFGEDALLVRSVPALGRGKAPLDVLQDMVDEIADGASGSFTPTRDAVYVMCSCKMAVKAGDRLAHAEMVKLVQDLGETENPYLCPHGRPITIVLPKSDLLRRFKR